MKIEIHSFQTATTLKAKEDERTVMIRISDPDYPKERDAELLYPESFEDVLKVSFHDLTDKQLASILEEESDAPYRTITEEQAREILSFIEKYQDCENVVIHCSAGISRSSAVAVGIARFLMDAGREKEIWESKLYLPNETVVSRLTEQLKQRKK